MQKKCKYCGKEFDATKSKRLYCSDKCKKSRWRERMNSLEITAYKAYAAHRKAFNTWDNGNIDKVWLDDDKNICIRYDNGKWWHYSVSKSGEWMWW